MTEFSTLYKRDSKGNVREWRMEVDGGRYRTVAGLQDGQQVISEWKLAEPKNVGKKNATTSEEQAISEVGALYTKKLDVDYHSKIENIDTPKIFAPMLADNGKWEKNKGKVSYDEEVYYQPKLDGIRCIATRYGLWSRKGKLFNSCPHIMEALAPLFLLYPDAVLDGELYNHDMKDDFEDIVSLVKRSKSKPEDLLKTKDLVQLHLYDFPTMMHDNFIDRFRGLIETLRLSSVPTSNISKSCIRLVSTYNCASEEIVDYWYDQSIDEGYEGGIIRINRPYLQKRTKNLLKRKDFEDAEFTIVRIEEGTGNWAGCAKRLIFQNDQGECGESGAGMAGNRDYMREVFENRDAYIGKQATIKFFGRTKNLKPRIPVVKVLHLTDRV